MRACLGLLILSTTAACTATPRPRPDADQRVAARMGLVDVVVENEELRRVVRRIAVVARRRILVAPGVEARVSLGVRDAPWRAVLDRVAAQAGCEVEEAEGVLLLTRPARVTIQGNDANVRKVLQLLAAYSGKDISIEPELRGRVSPHFKDLPWDEALSSLAADFGAAVVSVSPEHLHVLSAERLASRPTLRRISLKNLVSESRARDLIVGEDPSAFELWSGEGPSFALLDELRAASAGAEVYLQYVRASNAIVIRAEAVLADRLTRLIAAADRAPEPLASLVVEAGAGDAGWRINGRVCAPGSAVGVGGGLTSELVFMGAGGGRAVFLYRDRWYARALLGG